MTTMNNEGPADPSVHDTPRELPEPAAWVRDLASPQPHCVTSLLYRSKSDADAGTWYAPLYTADQMREAIAAERERSHELLQAADHIRAGLEAELAALRASAASVQADQRAEIDAANAVIDELRTDAERFKFVQENSEWRRYEGDEQDAPYSMLCVRLPYDADLSCKAMRVAAIDAARALRKGTP